MERNIVKEHTKNPLRCGLVVLGLGTGILSLVGCSNYTGEGNEFVVKGEVVESTWQSITAEVVKVDSADGWAANDEWFADTGGIEIFHDNCDCDGFWTSRKQYGELHRNGQVVSPESLSVGECVEFEGKVRTDNDGKYSHERPVYDYAEVVPCG